MRFKLRCKIQNLFIFWGKHEVISNGSRRLKSNTRDWCQNSYVKIWHVNQVFYWWIARRKISFFAFKKATRSNLAINLRLNSKAFEKQGFWGARKQPNVFMDTHQTYIVRHFLTLLSNQGYEQFKHLVIIVSSLRDDPINGCGWDYLLLRLTLFWAQRKLDSVIFSW